MIDLGAIATAHIGLERNRAVAARDLKGPADEGMTSIPARRPVVVWLRRPLRSLVHRLRTWATAGSVP